MALLRWPGWHPSSGLLDEVRSLFDYAGEDRATGALWGDGHEWWPVASPMDRLESELGVVFTHVAFQAYRNGAGCDWHTDAPFDAQAVLSLGASRTFGIRTIHPERHEGGEVQLIEVHHGDLVYMPPGFQAEWEHSVPVEPDRPGERISLVFRTVAKG